MKLKIFSSDFWNEEFKKQLWLMALLAGTFFLVIPVRWLMELENLTYESQYKPADLQAMFVPHGACSGIIWIALSAAAILCGVVHFAYLHSSRQMDFYGSFPVKREQIYWHKVLFAYLDFIVPLTAMMVLLAFLGAGRLLLIGRNLIGLLMIWIFFQIYFALVYLVTAFAMLLTGKCVLGIFGSLFLLGAGYFVKQIFESYIGSYFKTYVYSGNGGISYLSPFYYGSVLSDLIEKYCRYGTALQINFLLLPLGGAAAVIILFFMNRFLIRKRSAEAAGKSMAFAAPARVIQILLSVIGALWIGLIVKDFMYNRQISWVLISVFCGAAISYMIIQFVYTMDVRRCMQYKWQLVIAELLAMGTACVFCFDLFGYDTYLPAKDATTNISISIGNNYRDGGYTIDGDYVDSDEYRLETMHSDLQDELYQIMGQLIAQQDELQKSEGSYNYLRVRYTLSSGRKVNREYLIDYKEYKAFFARLFEDDSFLCSVYPYLGKFGKEDARVWINYAGERREILGKDGITAADFLRIYREEMRRLPGFTFVEENPCASINIQTQENANSFNMFLYPSCVKSIACLETMGWQIEPLLVPERIREISLEDYRTSESQQNEDWSVVEKADQQIFTNPDDIAEIAPLLLESEYTDIWQDTQRDLYATITVESPGGYSVVIFCQLEEGPLPDILKKE